MAHYNFMLSCVCLLQLKQEDRLILDEKYALLRFHYSTTSSVQSSWFVKYCHSLLRLTMISIMGNLHFKLQLSCFAIPWLIWSLHSSIISQTLSPKCLTVVRRNEPGAVCLRETVHASFPITLLQAFSGAVSCV